MVLSWFGARIFFLTFAEGGERGQDTQLGSTRSVLANVRARLSAGLTLEIGPTAGRLCGECPDLASLVSWSTASRDTAGRVWHLTILATADYGEGLRGPWRCSTQWRVLGPHLSWVLSSLDIESLSPLWKTLFPFTLWGAISFWFSSLLSG